MSMSVLVACEYSGVVRDAFRKRGHLAMSCDLRETDGPDEWHFQGDVRDALKNITWDMIIAFPPCQHLSVAGAQFWPVKEADGRQQRALDFVKMLADAPAKKVVIENPLGALSRLWRKPDQVINPWQFGDPWKKRTCLWLRGVEPLTPTKIVKPRGHWVQNGPTNPGMVSGTRGPKIRARTFAGIARAMAEQWG